MSRWRYGLSQTLARQAPRNVGGETWIVRAPTGDGVRALAAPADVGTVTGLVMQAADDRPATAAPGSPTAEAPQWRLRLIAGTVAAGQEIRSQAQPTVWRFRIVGPADDPLWPDGYLLEQL